VNEILLMCSGFITVNQNTLDDADILCAERHAGL